MKKRDDGSQLSFDLSALPLLKQESDSCRRVVAFVDHATLEARRDAVRRVANSGVFSVPHNLRIR